MKTIRVLPVAVVMASLVAGMGSGAWAAQRPAGTPAELVAAYDQLADTILDAKKTEWHMVQAILATTYNHAMGTFTAAQGKLSSGQDVRADLEKLADLVSQLGNEGDASVAAVRKRLLEGGHHHNAKGEEQGIYDEGFVIVTRAAKKAFLDAANNIAKMASSADADRLAQEWKKVEKQYQGLW